MSIISKHNFILMHNYNLTHLEQLESEAIFILRETAAQFERINFIFLVGKIQL